MAIHELSVIGNGALRVRAVPAAEKISEEIAILTGYTSEEVGPVYGLLRYISKEGNESIKAKDVVEITTKLINLYGPEMAEQQAYDVKNYQLVDLANAKGSNRDQLFDEIFDDSFRRELFHDSLKKQTE